MLYAAVQVTAPAVPLVTLSEAKDFLRRDDASLDGPLQIMVDASIGELEATTGLRLINQTVKVRADCFGDFVALNVGPVTTVTEIRYLDQAGTEQLLDAGLYQLIGAGLERGILPAIGATLPAMRTGRGSLCATLSVGYGATAAAVPQQLRWAALALIRGRFDDRPVDLESLIVNHRLYA